MPAGAHRRLGQRLAPGPRCAGLAKIRDDLRTGGVLGPIYGGLPAVGYRIDVEQRWHWHGHGAGGGESCYLERSPQKTERQRLRHLLDCHNVTLAEWLLLAAMEGSWSGNLPVNLCRHAANFSEHLVGVAVSPEECRTALEACLRNGWLRALDRHV